MNFYSTIELKKLGFSKVGKNVEISKNVNFYNFSGVIGSNCRIDDYSILIGKIKIHNYVHIAAYNLISASKNKNKIEIMDFSGIGPHSYISCSTENYLSNDISNPTIKKNLRKNIISSNIQIGKNVLVGAGSYIISKKKNVNILIGNNVSIGTKSIVRQSIKSNYLVYNKGIQKLEMLKIKKNLNFSKLKKI